LTLFEERNDELELLEELAEIYEKLGSSDTALRIYQTVLRRCQETSGPSDLQTLRILGCISDVYLRLGLLDEAIQQRELQKTLLCEAPDQHASEIQ
jgi:lipopolysaccharide biosynthesis regulator YciM